MDIISFEFIALLALVVTAITQTIKSHPKITGQNTTYVSAFIGVLMSYLWYAAKGDFVNHSAWHNVDWMNIYRAFANGIVATTTAWVGYNAQKAAPIPNLLPTATEINQKRLDEQVEKQQSVVEAVVQGVEPDVAKETVGLKTTDPPPNDVLEAMKPPIPIPTDDTPIG